MATPYDSVIQSAAQQQNIDPRLLTALIGTEDATFNPVAVNPSTGATGLGQQIPDTARRLGIDPHDPVQSINGAARQLAENIQRYGNVDDAVRAYHGGTDKANWGPKTEDYVNKVSASFRNQAQANQTQASQKAQPSNDPLDQALAAKAAGQTAQSAAPQEAATDPLDAMLAAKASGQPATPANVPRGTQPQGTEAQQYRSTLSPSGQAEYDKLVSDLRSQANFIQAGPNPGLGDTLMGGAWRGVNDAADFLTGGLGFVGNRLGIVGDKTIDDYMHATQQIRDEYEASRQAAVTQNLSGLVTGKKPDAGIDWGRIIGQGAAGGGVTRLAELGGAGAASLLGRTGLLGDVADTAASGASKVGQFLQQNLADTRLGRTLQNAFTGGASAAVASPQSNAPLGEQTAIGAGIGVVAPPVLSKVVGALASPLAKIGQKAAPEASQAAQAVSSDIQQAAPSIMSAAQKDAAGNVVGIDKTQLPPHIQDILNTGPIKDLTPEQQNRVLNYEALGLKYSFADITRNPADAMVERNLAQNKELGDPIRQTDIAKNTSLLQAAQRAVDMTGEKPLSMYDLGSSIREHLLGQRDAMDAQIGQLYRQADQAAAGAPTVNLNPLVQTMQANRSQYLASQEGTSLIKGIRAQLQEFTGGPPKNPGNAILVDTDGNAMLNAGDIPPKLSFSDSERMRQFLNSVSNQDNYKLIKPLKDAIDAAQDSSASGGIYDQARALRASRGAQFDNNPAVANILNAKSGNYRVTSENVAKNALGKGADDLQSLIAQLQKGGDEGQTILNQLRSTTMQNAVSKSIDKTPNQLGAGNFSGLKFGDQLDAIGQKKMSLLFTPEQQNYLGALRRGAIDLTTSPKVPNPYNPSGTAAQHINMLDYLAKNAPPTWLGNAAQKAANVAPGVLSGAGLLVGGLKGAGAGAWAGNVLKSRVAKATEEAAEAATARQAEAASKPLEAMTAAQQREAQAASKAAQRQRLNQLIGQRLQGTAALGGALQPSNNP